jgi:hypothetical protein
MIQPSYCFRNIISEKEEEDIFIKKSGFPPGNPPAWPTADRIPRGSVFSGQKRALLAEPLGGGKTTQDGLLSWKKA